MYSFSQRGMMQNLEVLDTSFMVIPGRTREWIVKRDL